MIIAKLREERSFLPLGFLIPYFYCALFLLAMYILMRIAIMLTCFFGKRDFLANGKATITSVAAHMICRYGEDNVISHRYFPMTDDSYEEIPLIVIMQTGIAVIEARNATGNITPSGDVWHQSYVNRYGDTKTADLPNPVLDNEIHAEALEEIFREARFRKIPKIVPITVIPAQRVRFHGVMPKEITDAAALPRFLKNQDRGRPLSRAEKKAIREVLRQYAKRRRQAPTNKNKNRR